MQQRLSRLLSLRLNLVACGPDMNIEAYIKENGAASVAKALAGDEHFAVFNLLWNTPDELLPACKRMGFVTTDDVLAWVSRVNDAVGNPKAFADAVDPDINIDLFAMPTVQWRDIHAAVASTCKLTESFFVDHSDASYKLPTRVQWSQMAQACPSRRKKHTLTDTHDCDDFVKHFLGWLASKGLGNLACGHAVTIHYQGTRVLGGHSVVLVMDADQKLWMIEPQTGAMHDVNYPNNGGFLFATEVKLARLYF